MKVVLAAIMLTVMPVTAQESIDVDKTAQCLVAHTSDTDATLMKQFMVAALQENASDMKLRLADLNEVMMKVAVDDCEIDLTQFEDPAFHKAATRYGEMLGQKIMREAMSRIQ